MAVYYSVSCPHCGQSVESGKDRSIKYGSPFRTCRYCGKGYIDTNYIEPGLYSEKEFKKSTVKWGSFGCSLFCGLFLLGSGIAISEIEVSLLGMVIIGLCAFTFIKYLRYRPQDDKALQHKIRESKQRLSDPYYVIALWKAQCHVTPELVAWAKATTEKMNDVSNDITAPTSNEPLKKQDISPPEISQASEDPEKESFTVDTIASGLIELCVKEILDVVDICSRNGVFYSEKRLILSTFAYYYVIWLLNFGNITLKQSFEVEQLYKEGFSNFNRKHFENSPFKEVLENESLFEKQLKRVNARIRTSFDDKERIFYDAGISDEYILEFIENDSDKDKIKEEIVIKILKDWAFVAQKAGQHLSIED